MKMSYKTVKKTCSLFFLSIFIIGFLTFLYVYNFGYTPPILMYHHIKSNRGEENSKLIVTPYHFEMQMKYLSEQKYNVVPLDKLFEWIKFQKKIPSKTIAITFDDGFENNFTHAFPILRKFDYPATIFLTVNRINHPGYLSWRQISLMEDHKISFGSHTLNHTSLSKLNKQNALREIRESKEILVNRLRKMSQVFCYPYGTYDSNVQSYIQENGYIGAVSASPNGHTPLDDIYGFKRIRISNSSNNLHVFWFETSGFYGFIRQIQKKLKRFKKDNGITYF